MFRPTLRKATLLATSKGDLKDSDRKIDARTPTGSPHVAPPVYSLVVPIYNEEAVLPLFFARIGPVIDRLDGGVEVVLVDDGSRDGSAALVEAQVAQDPRYRLAKLSRNFGQQAAISAELDLARGDAVIIMDADLQDLPELVFDLVDRWKTGSDVVCARRAARPGDGRLKVIPASLFYGLVRRIARVDIPSNVGDFRLVDRKVVDVVRRMPERDRFVRGLFSWAGFRHSYVTFDRPARAAGGTKYGVLTLAAIALDAIIGFSDVPLRLALWFGLAVSGVALAFGLFVIVHWLGDTHALPGWSSTIFVTAFLCGSNMLMTGIMGLYVGRIYSEVKGRPLYVIDRTVGTSDQEALTLADARGQLKALRRQLRAYDDRMAS